MVLTPQIAAVISFGAGAFLFFGIGFFLARISAKPEKTGHKTDPPSGTGPSRDADGVSSAAKQVGAISRRGDEALGNYRSLKAYTARQKEKTRLYFDAAKTRVAELNMRLEAARDATHKLKEKAGILARQLAQSDLEKEALLREKTSFLQALEKKEQQLSGAMEKIAALSVVENDNRALLEQVEKLEGQQKDIEELRDENHWMKLQFVDTEALKDDILELKKENARLTALGMILEKPLSRSASAPLEGLGGSFQHIADQLSQAEGSRGVVLADDLGLLIAGTGDHMEAMAGMAAIFSEVCIKIDSMFPLGDIDAMKITNRQNLTICMQPFEIASVDVIITTLSVGAEPDRDGTSKLIEQVTASG